MYPAAMVIATSALGVAVVQRLKTSKKVGRRAAWAIQGIFAAKLSMLVLPQVTIFERVSNGTLSFARKPVNTNVWPKSLDTLYGQ